MIGVDNQCLIATLRPTAGYAVETVDKKQQTKQTMCIYVHRCCRESCVEWVRSQWAVEPYMLCMLKHTLFSCVYAKGVFSIHKITTACNCNKTLGLLCSKFNAAFSLKVAENYNYSYEMHKNCCHQSCSFWSRYASNRFLAGASPQTPLGKLIVLLPQTS